MNAHPREVLLGAQGGQIALPVCDHYCGVEVRMRKSLALQAELMQRYGACVFDVTLDCEDGAPVGGEADHRELVLSQLTGAATNIAQGARVGTRVHPVDHPAFADDVATLVSRGGALFSHIMVPKVDSVADIERAVAALDAAGGAHLPLQCLIESPLGVHNVHAIAAHHRVQSISFGLMDFVSAHGGAIPASAMGVRGQFEHPLVVRAKLEIASACHAFGKVPSHSVVTEFKDKEALRAAATQAAREFGFTRMWSIHPDQIEVVLEVFAPSSADVAHAVEVMEAAVAADWAPVQVRGRLEDRASYRYFWQVLERAHQTGVVLPATMQTYFSSPVA
jgi:citrate lyase subunit beta / citryl-CoA lyase